MWYSRSLFGLLSYMRKKETHRKGGEERERNVVKPKMSAWSSKGGQTTLIITELSPAISSAKYHKKARQAA